MDGDLWRRRPVPPCYFEVWGTDIHRPSDAGDSENGSQRAVLSTSLYLVPRELIRRFRQCGLLLTAPFAAGVAWHLVETLRSSELQQVGTVCLAHAWQGKALCLPAVWQGFPEDFSLWLLLLPALVFFSVAVAAPLLWFGVAPVQVLPAALGRFRSDLDGALDRLVARRTPSLRGFRRQLLRRLLTRGRRKPRPMDWMPSGAAETGLLVAAQLDFMHRESLLSRWRAKDDVFFKLYLYLCSPAWAGFLTVVVAGKVMAKFGGGPGAYCAIVAGVLWAVWAYRSIHSDSREFISWCERYARCLDGLPAQLRPMVGADAIPATRAMVPGWSQRAGMFAVAVLFAIFISWIAA